MKIRVLFTGLLLLCTQVSWTQGFKVSGNKLMDACGNEFIMKGMNVPLAWFVNDVTNNIANLKTRTGANCLRIVVTTSTSDNAWQTAVQRCIDNKMIPMVELHDVTGNNSPSELNRMAQFWASKATYLKQPNIAKHILINIANEWSDWFMSATATGTVSRVTWRDAYITAVNTIRNAGITTTLVVDAAGYGQDNKAQTLLSYASAVQAADPQHNCLFSIHMYCEWAGNSSIATHLPQVKNAGIPVIVGEFGYQHSEGSGTCDINESQIISTCQANGIGWLAWSQKGNGGGVEYLDLCNDWGCTSLSAWGSTVINGANGTKTAVECSVFSGASCPTSGCTTPAPGVTGPVSYCQGATAVALSATGTSLKWYTSSTGGTAATSAPVPGTTTVGTVTYYVSQTLTNCEGPRSSITVHTLAVPTITPYTQINGGSWLQQNSAELCAGGSVSFGPQPVTATGWSWTGPNGFTASTREVALTAIAANQGGTYTASYTSGGCTSTQLFTLTVNSLPAAPSVSTPITYCQNAASIPLTATGTGLKWYTVSSGGTSSSIAPTPSTSSAGASTHYVSQTINGCEGPRSTIAVNVNALPVAPSVSTPVTYCQHAASTPLTATGTGLKWYTVSSGGTSSSIAPTPSTSSAGTTTHYVSQTASGCEGSRASIAVIVSATPSAPGVATPVTYCQNSIAVPLIATGTELKWYTVSSGGTSSSGSPTPSTVSAGSTDHYVSQTVNGCESTRGKIQVVVNAAPEATITAVGPTTFPQGSSVELSANTGPGLNHLWYKGSTQVGTGANYTAEEGGTYTVEVTNASGCKTTSSATIVTVNANQPSVIVITSPEDNSTTNGPVIIHVSVSDPDGGIVLVEYLDGTTVIGTSTSQPYTMTWNNPAAGSHAITVRVTDSNGGITTSSPVTISTGTSTGIGSTSGIELSSAVYPNPVNKELHIEAGLDLSQSAIRFTDMLGEELVVPLIIIGKEAKADVSGLAEGTYFLWIRMDDYIGMKKVTVIH